MDKQKYILSYETLKYYISKGMILKKTHRAITYDQKPWMKSYIELNTHFRTQATTDFEKDLYKLMSNAVFGKRTYVIVSTWNSLPMKSEQEK